MTLDYRFLALDMHIKYVAGIKTICERSTLPLTNTNTFRLDRTLGAICVYTHIHVFDFLHFKIYTLFFFFMTDCKDAYGHCVPIGQKGFSGKVDGVIYDNCTCKRKGRTGNEIACSKKTNMSQ